MAKKQAPNKQGTPTHEQALAVLDAHLSGGVKGEGMSFARACEFVGVNRGNTWKVINGDDTLRKRYYEQRLFKHEANGDKVMEVAGMVLQNKIAPDAARVVIDAMKWEAGRQGNKLQIEHTGKDGGPIEQEITVTIVSPTQNKKDVT